MSFFRSIARRSAPALLLIGAIALSPRQAAAATSTWVGGSSAGTWSVAGNWNGGVPGSGNTALFTANGTNAPTINAATTVGELLFGSGGSFSNAIGGTNTLTLNGATGLDNESANTITFNVNITLGAAETWKTGSTGGLTFGNAVNLSTFFLTMAPASGTSLTFNGIIGGTGGIIQNGSGTTILTAANTYTGNTTISSGTLQIGAGATGSLASAAIANAGTLAFNRTGAVTYTGVISGAGALIQQGTGTLILTGTNTMTGVTTISAGTLSVGSGGATGALAASAITDNGTLIYNSTGNSSFAGVISGTGALVKAGASTLILTKANTYTGATTISAGMIQAGTANAIGSSSDVVVTGTLNLANNNDAVGSISGAGAITLGSGVLTQSDNTSTTFSGVISGTGGLIQAGTGTLVLTGANTYTGATTISAGTLSIGNGGAVGTLATTSGITDNGALIYNSTANSSFASVISGTGSLTKAGASTLILTKANTYTGDTTISAGMLQAGTANAIGSSSDVIVTGTLNLANNNDAVGSISGAGAITLGSGVLTQSNNTSTTFSGVISGTGGLIQAGTGTLVLSGANTYTGATTISAGTLAIGAGGTAGAIASTVVTDNGTLAFNRTDATTFAGVISGTGALIQAGTGTTFLSATNTYTGATTISAGTLVLGAGGATGTISNSSGVTDNGQLAFAQTSATTYGGVISGTGTLTQGFSGTTVLTGANTYSGATSITSGVLQIGAGGTAGSIASTAITDNATLAFNRTDTSTYAGVISGTGVLIQAGSGTLVLTGASTYTGNTTISAGSLQIGDGGNTGSIASAAITDNATLAFNQTDTNTYAGVISGTGALVQAGTGTLVLNGANTYTGGTTISAGALQIGSGTAAGTLASSGITDNGSLVFNNTGTSSYAGVISGTGTLQLQAGTLILTKANTYTGDTTISAGMIQAGTANAIGSSSDVIVTGTLNLANNNDAVGSISGSGAITLGSGVLTQSDSASTTFSGVISGTGGLIQAGSGTLVLSGANTYTGATTISAGALQLGTGGTTGSIATTSAIADNGALIYDLSSNVTLPSTLTGSGTLTQAGTGTLLVAGTASYTGATTINSGGVLQVGAGAAAGSITSSTAITNNGVLTFDTSSSPTYSAVIAGTGSLIQAGSGTLVLIGANTYTGATTISAGILQLGNGGATGSIANSSAIVDNATLAINQTGSSTLSAVISGTGALTKAGTGTLVLTSANTFSGNTTISAGVLQLGNGGSAGSLGTGNIVDNGALVVNQTGTVTEAGIISGTGVLTQAGTGTLILTATNTYTGATTISAGALQLGNGGATGSIPNTSAIADNGALIYDLSSNVTLPSTLTGSGTLTQAGTGTLLVAGTASYTGATTINSGGVLQVGAGAAAGSITSSTSITNNGVLTFDTSNSPTYSAVIAGTGSLIQAGTGTLVLTGANTYTGATTISAGALELGNGGATGSIANSSAIVDNASLIVNRSGSVLISGAISGTGTLTKLGSGTLVLSGANTYAGNTTISAGALQLGNAGTTGSVAGNIVDNSSLIFNRTDSLTESGIISGSGSVTQAGTGTTLLTNTNTYTGGTNINAGTLQINNAAGLGTILGAANAANVQGGATLGLTGGVKVTGSVSQAIGLLTLNSNGSGTAANLTSSGGINSWEGDITLNGNAAINETAGGLLYIGTGYVSTSIFYYNNLNLQGNTLTLNTTAGATNVPNYQISPLNAAVVYAPTNIFLQSPEIYGTGGINVTGSGVVTMLAMYSNSYTGPTTVTSGTLIVDGQTGVTAVPSSTVVVGSSGGVSPAVLQTGEGMPGDNAATNFLIGTYNSSTNVASTSMTIYQNGTFNMNNGSDTIASLTMVGGTINEGAYSFNTLLAVTSGVVGVASSTEAVIKNGNFGISASSFTFNIAKGTTGNGLDMEIDGAVEPADGFTAGSNQVIKTGAGTLMFQGNNSYAGTTDIQQGILAIQSNSALGQAQLNSTTNGTIVESGAQLQLQQNSGTNLNIAAETVTLNGTGISNTGALLNASGNNTWSGKILVNSAGSIDANTGSSLNILAASLGSTIVDGVASGANLTTGGAGLITVNGGIGANIGNVIQNGTGTTVLAGVDTYATGTTVSSGALRLTNNSALAGATNGASVISGATLQLAQDASGGNINETGISTRLNGTGNNSGNGALENVNGNNTYNGAITLGSAAQINADTGSNLRLTGGVTNAGNLLTVAGGGNTTVSSPITGTGGLTMSGTGTLTLSAAANANTFSGVTSVNTGTLTLGAANQLGTGNTLAIASGAVVNVTNTIQSISKFTGNGTMNFGTSNANSQVTINGADTFNGIFTGTGTIIIPTGASLTLGPNGANLINVGGVNYNFYDPTLNIVLSGGTLNVNGTNDQFGTLTVTANSTLNFAGGSSVVDFVGNGTTGGVSINSGVTLSVSNWVDTVDYFYSDIQPGTRFNMPLNQIVFDAPTWMGSNTTWLTYSDGPDSDHQITPVPEPSTYGAIAVGFALALTGAVAYRRRKIQARA